MNVRNLLTINAILVALVFLTALLFPTFFLNTNGLETMIGWVYIGLDLLLGISFFYFAIKELVVSPA